MFLNEFLRRASKIIFEYVEPITYLKKRGIEEADIRKYGLGYVRLASVKEDGSEDYRALSESTYNFRLWQNKILFPIKNILGVAHGVCTRDLEKKRYVQYFLSEAKKIGAFFGLFEALPYIRKTKKVFVHEGAINSISFAKVFPNSISSLTSFLNEQQFETLSFICGKIILVYDGDKAGYIGIDKTIKLYGDRFIDHVNLGSDDSNVYLQMLGLSRFESYVRSKVPIYLQK